MKLKIILTLILNLFFVMVHAQNNSIIGDWYTSDQEGKIEIYKCKSDKICGKIVWLKEPNEEDGSPKMDINNPDEKKHNNPIIGMDLLKDFEETEHQIWENGTIYDPKNGKMYKCKLTLVSDDKLNVRGFIGFSFLGRTEEWVRAN